MVRRKTAMRIINKAKYDGFSIKIVEHPNGGFWEYSIIDNFGSRWGNKNNNYSITFYGGSWGLKKDIARSILEIRDKIAMRHGSKRVEIEEL